MGLSRWVVFCGLMAALAAGCAGTRNVAPSRPPAPGETPPPAPSPTKLPAAALPAGDEAEAALVELEDRRRFDEPLLAGLSAVADPATRARTALAVGRIGDPRGEPFLKALLLDPAPRVREWAAFASGILPGSSLTPDLVPLLVDGDGGVQATAAKAIAFLAKPAGEDALVGAISPAPPALRAVILRSLWKFGDEKSEAAALPFASAAERDPRVRRAALYALSRKPRPGSASVLAAALADEDVDAAAMAARGLGVLGAAEAVEPLAKALDGRTPLVISALFALEAVFDKNPGAALSEERRARVLALAGDANTNLAVPALTLLRRFAASDREASRRLWAIALSGSGRRRQVAIQSLAAALKEGAESAISSAAASPDRFVRAAAADAVSFLPAAAARPWRERFAEDREVVVRLANLGSLRTPEAARDSRSLVLAALTDRDAGVRSSAVDALALAGDASALVLLADAEGKARDEVEADVAISVIGACEKLKADPGAAALVEEIARHGRTLPARLARRSLLTVFGRAAESLPPAPEYETGRTRADYAALLAEARRPMRARVETSAGGFTIRLAGGAAPLTVMNFVTLARKGYFDGVVIHRVVPNFVLQDGDPTATGNGGPGWEIRDELNPLEYGRGTVGMALSGPDTGGSQWFATHSPQPHLNGIYTIFGQVIEGQGALERIGQDEKIVRVTISEGAS